MSGRKKKFVLYASKLSDSVSAGAVTAAAAAAGCLSFRMRSRSFVDATTTTVAQFSSQFATKPN